MGVTLKDSDTEKIRDRTELTNTGVLLKRDTSYSPESLQQWNASATENFHYNKGNKLKYVKFWTQRAGETRKWGGGGGFRTQ